MSNVNETGGRSGETARREADEPAPELTILMPCLNEAETLAACIDKARGFLQCEGIAGEIGTLHEALYAAIQSYAAETNAAPIIYDSHSYPYFFADTNGNGTSDPDEAVRENGYATWTPRLLKAAYNYQYVAKDPGGFAHNGKYLLQVLYDSLRDIGADVSAYTRPAAPE